MENIIDNKDKFFKGQTPDENFVLFFRKHWITLISTISIFIVICLITVGFVSVLLVSGFKDFNQSLKYFIVVSSFSAFSVYVHWFFLRLFEHFMTVCVFSDHRVLALSKTTYKSDVKETAGLGMIQDVKKNQEGLLRNFLRFGDLVITLSSSSAIMILSNVPNVDFHFRALIRARQNFISLRRHQPVAQQAPPQTQEQEYAQPASIESITYDK